MKRVPLVEALKEYVKLRNAPFSMPGHKSGRGFKCDALDIDLTEFILSADITEVDGLDNLHKPEGVLKEALDMLSNLYGSEKSYFLVNGSTSGNLIMSYTCFDEGDKVLVERNCHRSIMNSLIMRKLKPIYMENTINPILKAPESISREYFIKLLSDNDEIKGIFLTYPNYYGIGCDIKFIIDQCKKRDIKVLVDCAHGAHFGIHERLPKNPVELGADMVVMSAHKTLPSFTQTSYLHINNKMLIEKADFYFGVFQSTSPSYMFMASLDYSRAFLEYEGKRAYDNLFDKVDKIKSKINNLSYIKVFDKSYIHEPGVIFDDSRLVLFLSKGLSGHKLLDVLRDNRIQAEMSGDNNVVLLTSPFNTEDDFVSLLKTLEILDIDAIRDTDKSIYETKLPIQDLIPADAFALEKEIIPLETSLGRTVGENIIPYPPGVPMLIMGEKIEYEHIEVIKKSLNDGITMLGINSGNIKVIKENQLCIMNK
ncbi:lysine decarboxylase [Clostridium zeae]|uniref:Lysine decarboxylase n=1 Tax=Clostridium zeae TaxID=2759022 RepID=A0ABQ1EDQ9_9CLOT|nr:aminotransferase class V-fold PLP-dependent enzyme [Clostridium zeae]GFZ32912.1 lysine decarboxylase [Clostridium zeae]